jgi:hypothetical protein
MKFFTLILIPTFSGWIRNSNGRKGQMLYVTVLLKAPAANLPPVSTTQAANFATSFASVVDTGGK